ncbi:GIY-YIG nuclease family protein [candidate division WWE3 bacterium]|uniref:GIY-YIG nuclease family protein n=1 Tax=candidate division WWE3 bacterium TaxID=2053526 RepID=A0A7X9DL52_UNCKA|nr:GIY-YIG nuclease family protein [candidate division WWE3 bacterium]
MKYFVYLVKCSDNSLYCGYTTDLDQRINEHNNSNKGAKYTKYRRPVKLVYSEKFNTLSEALKREYQIKNLTRDKKEQLIKTTSLQKK